jgi:predicted transglutaminase-like cysteine proteinase
MSMHKIKIPGMDYELCETCGYFPTEYLIEETMRKIDKLNQEMNKKVKSQTHSDLIVFLSQIKKKRQIHLS